MKVTMNIDCTPEEARRFLGLPDVAPMQDAVLKELQERMLENIARLDPETMMRSWFGGAGSSWEEMQKAFWSQFGGGGGGSGKGKGKE